MCVTNAVSSFVQFELISDPRTTVHVCSVVFPQRLLCSLRTSRVMRLLSEPNQQSSFNVKFKCSDTCSCGAQPQPPIPIHKVVKCISHPPICDHTCWGVVPLRNLPQQNHNCSSYLRRQLLN